MRFLWPDALWLLAIPVVLVAGYLLAMARRKRTALRFASLMLVREALGPSQRIRRHLPPALLLLGATAAIVATARPTATVTLPSEFTTIILAIDVSRSMRASDVQPTRIHAAQEAARGFFAELPRNVRVGIVTFAGTAAIAQTPTDNRDDLLAALERFRLQRATATGSGLLVSLALLFPDDGIDLESLLFGRDDGGRGRPLGKREEGPRDPLRAVAPGSYTAGTIILLSDGRRTTGPDPLAVAKMAAERGVRVYTVGFGSKDGSVGGGDDDMWAYYMRLDETALKGVARLTGGEYFHAGTAADLQKVYQTLGTRIAMERRETELSALLAGAAVLLMLLGATLSMLWFPAWRATATRPA